MQICEQLNCFENIVRDCACDDVAQIEALIKRLRNKADDKKLYLAVIGEFSSGKSTFINALLRKKLLKMAVQPTTACAAYIEKCDGSACIDVAFGRCRFKTYGMQYAHLHRYIYDNYHIEVQNLQHLIDLLTSEQKVAKDVTSLHLRIPDINLPDNICIIDTPGFDPAGDDASANHFEITRSVVENVADAAIVIINSHKPFSDSLRSFLSDYVRKYLHRCLFVCNRLDQIGDRDEEEDCERDEVIRFVRSGLRRDFGMSEAKVFPCSANSMVNPSDRDVCAYWQNVFKNFEGCIWPLLSRQKDIILTEHINHLAAQLNKQIKRLVKIRTEDLFEKRRRLRNSRVEAIESVTKELVDSCKLSVNEIITDFKSRFIRQFDKKRIGFFDELKKKIDEADSLEELKDSVLCKLEGDLGDIFRRFEHYAEDKSMTVSCRLKGLLKVMQDGFNEHYKMFPALKYRENDFSVDVNIAEKLVFTFSSFEQFVEGRQGEAAEAKRDNAFGGLAAGVIAGFAAANIPGAILGAIAGIIAGMMAGSSRAGEITDKSKSELKRCLCDELDKYFSHYREMYIVNIDSLKSDIDSRAEQYGRKHIRSYGEKVKLLIERQKMVNQRLNESIKKLNEYEKMLLDIEESNERELIVLRCRS